MTHDDRCEGPDEDGDWFCPISDDRPGLCPQCLHKWGVEREMTKTITRAPRDGGAPRIWYLCYTCAHGC